MDGAQLKSPKHNLYNLYERPIMFFFIRLAIVTTLAFFTGSSALATELNYNWQSGNTYRFQATSVDNVSMSGMGMNMKDTFTLNSTFAIHIESGSSERYRRRCDRNRSL